MASTYSTNLAIELIGTGDQAGAWGNTTNTNLGTLIEQAISGYVTQAVATGTDTTITIPDGATGVARNMYIELTGTGGASTNLIVPAKKKLYFIFNNSTGAVTVKVSGQTGVSVPQGKKMVLVNNGTDIVTATNYVADFGSNSATITQLTSTSATITNLTSTSLTLSNNPTLSGGTANGVLYLNASKLATSGSGLTFDGTNLGLTGRFNITAATNQRYSDFNTTSAGYGFSSYSYNGTAFGYVSQASATFGGGSNTDFAISAVNNLVFGASNAEQMRLTSTGLGIGTSSPAEKLDVNGAIAIGGTKFFSKITSDSYIWNNTSALNFVSSDGNTVQMKLTASGNLGLGVTPSAWGSGRPAIQFGSSAANYIVQGGAGSLNVGWNFYYDGSVNKYIRSDYASQYYQYQGQHVWMNAASGTAGNTITFTQAMTLDASGNLGVGTTSPSARLDVRSAIGTSVDGSQNINLIDTTSYALGNGGGVSLGYVYNSGGDVIGRAAVIKGIKENATNGNYASALTFSTTANSASTTEKARITSGGVYLVGTTNTAGSAGVGVKLHPDGLVATVSTTSISDSYNYYSETAGAYRFYVTNGGTVFATNTTISAISDQRLKENIRDLDAGLDAVMALKPRKFDWKEGKGQDKKDVRGFIAQEFEQVFPDLIDTWKDPAPEGEEPYKSVRQDLIPVLVKAIQELKAELDATKAEVAALKGA